MPRFRVRELSVATLAFASVLASGETIRAQTNVAPAAAPLDITMLDAGAAPRRALRYKLVAGVGDSVTMRQTISMTMEVGGMAMPSQALPATLMTTYATVSEVAADGSAVVSAEHVNIDLDTTGADPMLVHAMRPQMSAMKGVTMRYNISPTGKVSKMEFGAGAPAVLQAVQSMAASDQLSVPFPTEAVGVGARWKAVRPVTQNGLTIQQDIEYLVKSLGADSVVLEMSITQSAKDQVMDNAAMPSGASAKVRTLEGKGLSSMSIRFDRVQPIVDLKMNIKMAIDVSMGGESNTMNQTMVMEMKTVSPARP